eukprot:gnl/TRDRNA2_/TRDRNA2_76208_c0_seq1.p2 gnl/TRDRNA2_/TRDRNA2_76208_c0~~gnl/TRDRNA2_/TRDRNA2_76208_c0_seq1.p2  ORF type:complete len:106 (-),score=26.89 gnl/TRDRNA2_/TRDRNA2_76208_c0_seq1:157-474(-)
MKVMKAVKAIKATKVKKTTKAKPMAINLPPGVTKNKKGVGHIYYQARKYLGSFPSKAAAKKACKAEQEHLQMWKDRKSGYWRAVAYFGSFSSPRDAARAVKASKV